MTSIPDSLAPLAVPIGRLRPHPDNPRRGDVEAIKASLRSNGLYRPIVVNRRTMEVLAGNHTLEAARQLGFEEIAVTYLDLGEDDARRILAVDNRTNDLAGYDPAALAELLSGLPDLEGTGYDEAALTELIAEVSPPELPGPEEEVPPPPREPRTRPGQLFALGRHRLLCGDARKPDDYRRLLDGERPTLLFTDPPYGVDYRGKTPERLRIQGDSSGGLEALLAESFEAIDGALAAGAALYVCHPAGALSLTFGAAFLGQGWRLHQTLVWVKDSLVLGRSDYHYRHEPILFGYTPGTGRRGRGAAGWHGDNAQQSVLEVPRPRAAREHPTMKPPELVAIAVSNSSARGEAVLDPFAGSGSTLVACEAASRPAFLIERDPAYCDVIRERFERLSGERAEELA